jgi:hypothetical protein
VVNEKIGKDIINPRSSRAQNAWLCFRWNIVVLKFIPVQQQADGALNLASNHSGNERKILKN